MEWEWHPLLQMRLQVGIDTRKGRRSMRIQMMSRGSLG
jgi:hypothetical protein